MWMLIVVTTFWVHGQARDVSVYSFQTFETEDRCIQVKRWIDQRETAQRKSAPTYAGVATTAQCLRKE